MVIYFMLHYFQGYSGTDLDICGLVTLTYTLQALSFLFWWVLILGFPIFGDAIFIWCQENRCVPALLWPSFYFAFVIHFTLSLLQCLAAFPRRD